MNCVQSCKIYINISINLVVERVAELRGKTSIGNQYLLRFDLIWSLHFYFGHHKIRMWIWSFYVQKGSSVVAISLLQVILFCQLPFSPVTLCINHILKAAIPTKLFSQTCCLLLSFKGSVSDLKKHVINVFSNK